MERAKDTKYIKHYTNLEKSFKDPDDAFVKINSKHYCEMWDKICSATITQTKLKTYHAIYNNCENIPETSLTLQTANPRHNTVLRKYVTSSHDLENEKGRWMGQSKGNRRCKQCILGLDETMLHFIFYCERFRDIRDQYPEFPTITTLYEFFSWDKAPKVLYEMHARRR